MINKIIIKNYKIFDSFELNFNSDLNIVVGNNEAGKSTILEAINLTLSKRLNGRQIEQELSPYLFNKDCVDLYLKSLKETTPDSLPKILIELYFSENPELQFLRGSNNSGKSDDIGIKIEIAFNEDYKDEYEKLLENKDQIKSIPTEYYKVNWYSFANNAISNRSLPVGLSYIDATNIRLQSGTDYYMQSIISSGLETKERVELSVAYRKLKEQFSDQPSIRGINNNLNQKKGAITDKNLAISIDVSQKTNWETNLIPHLDDLPFQFIGKGEQSALKIMLALERQASESHIILIEEPENHLSFSSMNILISKIREKCSGKQIIITTHSAYILNKLGLDKVILLNSKKASFLNTLPEDTKNYFRKLSGYDTLRLILAKKAILVEGPSDELIIQKAYLLKYNKLPIEDGVDVISVRGLSFSRFLDIAKELNKEVVVVTDNDGDYENKVTKKYESYKDLSCIKICASNNNSLSTLEPQLVESNKLDVLKKIFNKSLNKKDMIDFMIANKADCALKIFDTQEKIEFPDYVKIAIE